jgi:hypothetical protein
MIDNFKYSIFLICKEFIGFKLQTYYILQNLKTSWLWGLVALEGGYLHWFLKQS